MLSGLKIKMDAGGHGHESQLMRGSQAKAIAREIKANFNAKEKRTEVDKPGWSWGDLNKYLYSNYILVILSIIYQ